MIKTLAAVVVLAFGLSVARAEDRVPREQCLKIACQLSLDLKQMLNTPIPTDPDIKRPVALVRDEHGAMLLPECKLSADTFAKAGTEPASIGQMWMHKIAPLRDNQLVPPAELQLITVGADPRARTVAPCRAGGPQG